MSIDNVQLKLQELTPVADVATAGNLRSLWNALYAIAKILNGGGYTGTFVDNTGKTVTVVNGVIKSVV